MIILSAIKQVLLEKKYLLLFVALIFILLFVFILIPVKTIPANTFKFQLSIFTNKDYFLMMALAILSSLIITTQIYAFRLRKANIINGGGVSGVGGVGAGAIFSTIIGTASCASCLSALFGFLGIGIGGVLFFLNYRFYFVAGIIGILLFSLYLSAKRIKNSCNCN